MVRPPAGGENPSAFRGTSRAVPHCWRVVRTRSALCRKHLIAFSVDFPAFSLNNLTFSLNNPSSGANSPAFRENLPTFSDELPSVWHVFRRASDDYPQFSGNYLPFRDNCTRFGDNSPAVSGDFPFTPSDAEGLAFAAVGKLRRLVAWPKPDPFGSPNTPFASTPNVNYLSLSYNHRA